MVTSKNGASNMIFSAAALDRKYIEGAFNPTPSALICTHRLTFCVRHERTNLRVNSTCARSKSLPHLLPARLCCECKTPTKLITASARCTKEDNVASSMMSASTICTVGKTSK